MIDFLVYNGFFCFEIFIIWNKIIFVNIVNCVLKIVIKKLYDILVLLVFIVGNFIYMRFLLNMVLDDCCIYDNINIM